MIVPSHRCGDCLLASVVDRTIEGVRAEKVGARDEARAAG
jgi:hypothetical protein